MDTHSISHFLQIWAFPPGLILLIAILAWLLSFANRFSSQCLYFLSYALLWLLSTPIVSQCLINQLQLVYPPLTQKELLQLSNPHNAIVILGSGIDNAPEYANRPNLSEKSLSRLHYAAFLYRHTKAPIIASGGNKDDTADTEANLMRKILNESYHIPVAMIEDKSKNTYEEAINLLNMMPSNRYTGLILVTNAWHMPRSVYIFKQAFKHRAIQIIPAPMGYTSLLAGNAVSDYLPQLSALTNSVYALHEYIGILWYRLAY